MNCNYKKNRGFTLIELLVVISIIGLLSSVVLASLNTARAKGADAAIKGNLQAVTVQAALFYENNSLSYGSALASTDPNSNGCAIVAGNVFADPTIRQAIISSIALGGTTGTARCTIGPGGQTWALAVRLKTGPYWCVSSSGSPVFNGDAVGGGTSPALCDDGS